MKVALVTGASSGIGKEIVISLLNNGYKVAVTGRDITKLEIAFDSISKDILQIEVDVMKIGSYKSIFDIINKKYGRLDLLVNNVGGGKIGETIENTTLEQWNEMITLNTTSVYFMIQNAIPYLTETQGTIINMSSILASRPAAGLGPYSAAKAAVEMITKTAALELASKQIRVLCIAPATIQTNFHTNAGMSVENANKYYDASKNTHPIGRIGKPEDISELVVFLADSSKAGFMTGSIISVDGGRSLTSSVAQIN